MSDSKLVLWVASTPKIGTLGNCRHPITVQSLYNTMFAVHSESCYNGTILQRNYRIITILWSFSNYSYVKFYGKKFESHIMTVLYLVLCFNKVCYKETALY